MAWMKFMAYGQGQIAGDLQLPVIGGPSTQATLRGDGFFALRYLDDDGRKHDYYCHMTTTQYSTLTSTRLRSDAFLVQSVEANPEVLRNLNARGLSVYFRLNADGGGFGEFSLEVKSSDQARPLVPRLARTVLVSEWPCLLVPGMPLGRSGSVHILTSVRRMASPWVFDMWYRHLDAPAVSVHLYRNQSPPRGNAVVAGLIEGGRRGGG